MYTMNFRAVWSSAAVLVLAGCASLQVRTDYDRGASFTPLRTYDLVDGEVDVGSNPAVNSPLLGRHIRYAVEAELDRHGYRKATSGTPDFRIAYQVVARERARLVGSGFASPFGFGRPFFRGRHGFGRPFFRGRYGFRWHSGRFFTPYYNGFFGSGFVGAGRVREYLRGTLVLDITDVRTGELIWRGWASKSLHSDPRPEKVRMYVDEAVAEMLEDFPSKP